jgi:hypothetical protein
MTYQSSEISVASGQPIELYDIAMGSTHWRITSCGEDITYLTYTYISTPCERNEIAKTEEVPKDSVEIKLPRGHALALLCLAGTPDEEVTLTIYRGHSGSYVTYFKGFLTYLETDAENIPTCTFEPRSSDLPFIGGRRRAMRICGHLLYGYRCGVNREAHRLDGTIDSIDGVTITATEFGAATAIPANYGDLTNLPGCLYNESEGTSRRVYDDDGTTYWATGSTWTDNWTSVQWPIAQTIKKIRIRPGHIYTAVYEDYLDPGDGCMKYVRIAGSNNGSVWTNIDANDWEGNCSYYAGLGGSDTQVDRITDPSEWITIGLDNDTAYFYYRMWIYEQWYATTELIVHEIEMIEADDVMAAYFFGAGGQIIVGTASRTITAQVGNDITINRPFGPSVIAGDSFSAYPGCGHTQNACVTKFDNILNYGGQTHLPIDNPYDSNLVY